MTKHRLLYLWITALPLLFFLSAARAESGIKEGYDENTEITVRGRVVGIERERRGPVVVRMKGRGRPYKVITAPPWYLSREGLTFEPGMALEVSGSKYFDRDGSLYIIGRSITYLDTGRTAVLRDSYCKPLWNGPHHNRRRQ
ncbi:MAG: hypothetical protein AB1805_06375 [Nitrospirota bacterium]